MKKRIRRNALVFILMFVIGIQKVLFGQEEKQFSMPPQLPCNEASWEGEGYHRGCGIGEALDASESMIEARDWAVRGVLFVLSLSFMMLLKSPSESAFV